MYMKDTLDNGIRIVSEKIPYVRSVSLGIWVGTGSRNENKSNNGISHFIEHMMFKGTNNRTAKEIAQSIDNIGGQLNAFTGKECTCYYTKTLDSHVDIAMEVLADMFFNSKFDKKDIEVEKRVVLEEICMYEDSPEELVHDVLSKTVWSGNSLGYPILGTERTLENLNKDTIDKYIYENYIPKNCVIAVAGNFDYDKIIELIKKYFLGWNLKERKKTTSKPVKYTSDVCIKEKDTEQVHVCMAFEGIEHGSDYMYPLLAVNSILGGGMSSRLFQKIREEKGLVYSIFSYPSAYKNAGMFTIYAGMNPKHLQEVISLVSDEIMQLKKVGIDEEQMDKSKEQLKGNYILGLESTSSRMSSIGKSEIMLGYINTPEQILAKIDRISVKTLNEVISRVFDFERVSFSAVGNLKKEIDLKSLIN